MAVRVRPSANEESVNGFQWKVESNRISLHRSDCTPVSGLSFAFGEPSSKFRVYELSDFGNMILSSFLCMYLLFRSRVRSGLQ